MTQQLLKNGLLAIMLISSASVASAHSGGLDGRLLMQKATHSASIHGGSGIYNEWLMEQEIKELKGVANINGASGGCGVWDDPENPGQGCTRDVPIRLPSR